MKSLQFSKLGQIIPLNHTKLKAAKLSIATVMKRPDDRTRLLCEQIEGIEPLPEQLLDLRSDDEIVDELRRYRPVTSERNVWAFWQTGWDTMKPWTQRNVISWVRRHPTWIVRVLDRVPNSASNITQYLADADFPECFRNQTMEGPYASAHSADLVRLPCLHEYGGVWLDVSIILFRSLEEICWDVLQGTNDYELAGFVLENVHKEHQHSLAYLENWFIAAKKGDPWIARWHKIFVTYWSDEGRVESQGVTDHTLFKHLNFGGYRSDMIDYLAQHVSYQRLRLLEDPNDGFSGPEYFQKHMYLLDCREEGYYLPHKTKWQGQVAFDLMQAPYTHRRIHSDVSDSAEQKIEESANRKKEAQDLGNDTTVGPLCNGTLERAHNDEYASSIVAHMISRTCLSKSVHGFKGDTQLSDLWNAKENMNNDQIDGSCAELLRYASIHVRQTRKLEPLKVEKIQGERVLKESLVSDLNTRRGTGHDANVKAL